MNIPQEYLDEPAFGQSSNNQKIDDSELRLGSFDQDSQSNETEDGDESSSSDGSDDVKQKVPYQRFEKVNRERREYQQRAEEAQERIERLEKLMEQSMTRSQPANVTPEEWRQVLGANNPLVDQFYNLLEREFTTREQRAADKAVENLQGRETAQREQIRQAEEVIDYDLNILQKSIGRKLSDDEGAAVLSIADELTPKDEDGKYAAPIVPLSAAFEVWQARSGNRFVQRNQLSSIIGANRGGTFTPDVNKGRPDPGAWRKLLN